MGLVLRKPIQWYYYTYPHTLRGQIHVKKDPQKLCLKTFGDYCTLDLVFYIFFSPIKCVIYTDKKKKKGIIRIYHVIIIIFFRDNTFNIDNN